MKLTGPNQFVIVISVLIIIGIALLLLFLADLNDSSWTVFGQTVASTPAVIQEGTPQNEILKDQVAAEAKASALPVDTLTIGGIVTAAGGLLLNDRRDKKKLEEKLNAEKAALEERDKAQKMKDKEIVEILTNLALIQYKVNASHYLYPTKNPKQILDLKSNNNPMDRTTISEENSIQINRLARVVTVNYDLAPLNMSVPTEQTIQATSSTVPENKPNTTTTNTTTE